MKKSPKIRIDQILVDRGLASSRARAQAMILAGQVIADDHRIDKASTTFEAETIRIRLKGSDHPFVSRGGVKLMGALKDFGLDPGGKVCLDIGASTGGFTDCLLQNGAAKVFTYDVGTNQLDYRLREDPRVTVREKVNARHLEPADFPESPDWVVMDVSFISVKKIIPVLVRSIPGTWKALFLIKPQFEVGADRVGKGGVVRESDLHREVLLDIETFCQRLGLGLLGTRPSVLKGESGNQEYFLYLEKK